MRRPDLCALTPHTVPPHSLFKMDFYNQEFARALIPHPVFDHGDSLAVILMNEDEIVD
jgi:hypothetical protein